MTGDLTQRARVLIERLAGGERDDAERDALLCDLLAHQAREVGPYGRLVRARGVDPDEAEGPDDFPALPTDVFRYARVAAHPESADQRVFRTSGTTGGPRGVHALRDLSLYRLAARTAASHALFPDVPRMRLVVLAPPETEAPDSSLSFMLARFAEWFARGETAWVWSQGELGLDALAAALDDAVADGGPVALLGTSFAFVHADDGLGDRTWALPAGSRVMHTGGTKGRSREISPVELRQALGRRYGVAQNAVVAEYGMTELSSQMYETTLREPNAPRRLWIPGWMRAVPVDPETLRPVPVGELGILRLDDVANVDTACAIQTSDLGRVLGDGIELVGRDPDATPRGCSLAVEEALEERR